MFSPRPVSFLLSLLVPTLLCKVALADEQDLTNKIMYGEKLFLQNMKTDNRWLTGNRYNRKDVLTLNQRSESEATLLQHYELYIRSTLNSPFMGVNDPKESECVKYGDKVHFAFNFGEGIYLMGGLHYDYMDVGRVVKGRKFVESRPFDPAKNQANFYTWELRSNQGMGHRDGSDPDPNAGRCIDDLSVVFIVNQSFDVKWLAGDIQHSAPGDDDGNYAFRELPLRANGVGKGKNIFSHQVEVRNAVSDKNNYNKYRWIMRRDLGDGTRGDALQCAAYHAEGNWKPLQTISSHSGAEQTIQYSMGMERTQTEGWSKTKSWELSVTQSIEFEGKMKGVGAKSTTSLSYSLGEAMTQSAQMSMAVSNEEVFTTTFGAGTVWQWTTEITDLCSPDGWLLKTKDLTLTSSLYRPPCCYPGTAIGDEHGPCLADTPCLCSDEVCNAKPVQKSDSGSGSDGGSGGGLVEIGKQEFDIDSIKGQSLLCLTFGDFCEGRNDDSFFCGFVVYWCE